VGGNLILGYDLTERGGALILNEDEAVRVRAIYDLYLQHGSLIPVVQELIRRDWRTKQWTTRKGKTVGGREFTKNRLYNLLTNMVYTGKIEFHGEVYEGEHQGIVEPEVWQTVQDRLRYNAKTGGRQVRNKYGALLKGILLCGSCQAGMVHTYTQRTPSKLYRYYVCVNAHQQGYNQCATRSVSAPVIEQAVVEQIRGIARNPQVVTEVIQSLEEGRLSSVETLQRERRLIDKELERIGEEIAGAVRATGKLATDRMADLQERATALELQRTDIQEQLAAAVGQSVDTATVRRTLQQFDGLWREFTPREQERFVKTLVEQVTYDGTTCTVTVSFRTKGIRQLCMEVESQ
jgi:site-specific DNA recombinase